MKPHFLKTNFGGAGGPKMYQKWGFLGLDKNLIYIICTFLLKQVIIVAKRSLQTTCLGKNMFQSFDPET